MDVEIKRLKSTPIKLVFFKDNIIGCFYNGDNFVRVDDIDDAMWKIIHDYYENERKEEVNGGNEGISGISE